MRQQLAFCARYMDERIRGGERVNGPNIGDGGSLWWGGVLAGANGEGEGRSAVNATNTKMATTTEVGVTGCPADLVGVNRPGSQLVATATSVNKLPGEVALRASGTGPGSVNWLGQGTVPVVSKEKPAQFGGGRRGDSQKTAIDQNPFLAKQRIAGTVVPFLNGFPSKFPLIVKLVWVKKVEGKEVRTETLLRDPQKIAAFYRERVKRAAMRAGLVRAPPAKAEPERGAWQIGMVLERKPDPNRMEGVTRVKVEPRGTAERQPILRLTANLPPAGKKRKADADSNVCAICLEEWDAERQRVIILAAKGTAHKCNHALYCNRCLDAYFRQMRVQAEKAETGAVTYRCPSNCDLGAKKPKLEVVYM